MVASCEKTLHATYATDTIRPQGPVLATYIPSETRIVETESSQQVWIITNVAMYTYLYILAILFIIEIVYFRIADRFNIIDKPNERSSHTKAVLRGGDIIFVQGLWSGACSSVFNILGCWRHLPLTPERLQKLAENYVSSNAKIKKALGVKELPVRAKDGLTMTIKSFEK